MELKAAEIMAAGTWTGATGGTNTFTADDLDSIVAAFDALGLKGRVPIKLGHAGLENDAQPALGWVERVYRKGSKLLADIVDVPRVIYDAIASGLYKTVSVEMLRNVQAGNRRIPWVLDAVALLGATQPAVGVLEDLSKLTVMARGCGLQGASRVTFKRGDVRMSDEVETLRAELREKDQKLIDLTFEAAVRDGKCLPREKVLFRNRFKDEGTVADAVAWLANAQKPTRGPATRPTNASDARQYEHADDEVGERVRLLMKSRREEGEPAISLIDATVLVLKADPDLGQRYKMLHGVAE